MGYQLSTSSCRLLATTALSILLGTWLYAVYPTLNRVCHDATLSQKNIMKFIAIISITCFSAYLIYKKRAKLKRAHYSISTVAMVAIFCLQLAYTIALVYKVNSLDITIIILMLPALVLLCCGPQVIETVFFPVLYFLLIVPVLQIGFKYDTQLYCLACALGYGYLKYKSFWPRVVLAITTLLLPFAIDYGLLNVLLKNTDFSYSEWLVFILSFLGICFTAHMLKEPRRVFISAISPLEFERSKNGLQNKIRHWVMVTVLVSTSMGFMPRLIESMQNHYWANQDIIAYSSSVTENKWRSPSMVTGDVWKPIFDEATQIQQSLYIERDNINDNLDKLGKSLDEAKYKRNIIYLSRAYYAPNLSPLLLLKEKNYFYNPDIWHRVTSKNLKIKLMNQKKLNLVENVVEVNGIQRLIWSWFDVRGFTVQAQTPLFYMIELISFLSRQQTGSAVMVLSTPISDSLEASRERLHLFLEDKFFMCSTGKW